MPPPREDIPAPRPERPAAPAPSPGRSPSRRGAPRWIWTVGAVALGLVLFLAIFDWNWLRGPAERFASRSMGRSVNIGHLDVRLRGLTPSVVLSDVTLGNAPWAGSEPMAHARELMFDIRLPTLLTQEIDLPHLRLTEADVHFVRDAEGRANWRFRDSDQPDRRNVRVLTIGLDDARVTYRDAKNALAADLHGFSREEGRYATRVQFSGKWREREFGGTADTGSVLSLRGSMQPFPMRIVGKAGATSIRAEGEVADISQLKHIDGDFAIAGPSLATLYETLNVALPDTPPYQARGHLRRDGDTYSYESFTGKIGSTDLAGTAKYELRQPRPMLTADLRSRRLDVADLGPLVGAKGRGSDEAGDGTPRATQGAETETAAKGTAGKASASAKGQGLVTRRVLPESPFKLDKLRSTDADVHLAAAQLRVPGQVPLQDFESRARLQEGVLTLQPLNFGFAGGAVVSTIVLDGRDDPVAGTVSADFKQVKLKQLFPSLTKVRESAGALGAQVRLKGRGNSIASLLGTSNGTIAVGMAGGRVSELAVWLVNLNGGELIPLLFGGDRPTPIRCAAAALDVRNGVGGLDLFVFDTDESRITGGGGVDFKHETLDITLRPVPKKPGLLSIRGPIHIEGPFGDVHFAVAPQSIARGITAIALGIVNPILALLPLVETGPGEDTNCRAVLEPVKDALRQSGKTMGDAPTSGHGAGKGPPAGKAPIVSVPSAENGKAAHAGQAPIVDVPPKK